MSKPTNLTPKRVPTAGRIDTPPDDLALGASTEVTEQLFEIATDVLPESSLLEIMVEDAGALEGAYRFADHLFGEEAAGVSVPRRTTRAVARFAGEQAVERALDGLSGPPTPGRLASALIGASNDAFDPRSNARVVTQFAAEIQPTAPIDGAVALAVDAASIIGRDDAMAELERINHSALSGEYGAPTQVVSMASNLVVDPVETTNTLTSPAAERGELGVFVRVGNDLADAIFDAQHGRYESEWEFRADP